MNRQCVFLVIRSLLEYLGKEKKWCVPDLSPRVEADRCSELLPQICGQ